MAARLPAASAKDIEIGTRIRIARRERGLSQTRLGAEVGVTFQQMQKYEKGANRVSASRLCQIAEKLGFPLDYFLDDPVLKRKRVEPSKGVLSPAELLQSADALRLVTAFSKIKSRSLRRHCVQLVQSLATEEEAP